MWRRFCILGFLLITMVASEAGSQESAFTEVVYEAARRLAEGFPKVEGFIVGVDGTKVLIDLGTKDGVYPGMELQVFREGEKYAHPITGQPLGTLDKGLGIVRVVQVRDRYSVAEVIRRVEGVELVPGDRARVSGARLLVALPVVDPSTVKEVNPKSFTKDLALALAKTGRFEVIEDRQLRASMMGEGIAMENLATPSALKALAEKLKVNLLVLGKLTTVGEDISLDLDVISTLTGNRLLLVTTRVGALEPRPAAMPNPGSPAEASAPAPVLPEAPSPVPADPLPPGVFRADFDIPLRAVAIADVDGDRREDLIFASADRLFVYTFTGQGFRLIWQQEAGPGASIIGLDAADINGNGRAELFVTNFLGDRLSSFVLEMTKKGQMERLWEKVNLFFRVLPLGEGGAKQLYGQPFGVRSPFDQSIHRYSWGRKGIFGYLKGKQYVQGPPLGVPRGFSLYGLTLADLNGDGREEILAVETGDTFKVYDLNGRLLHETSDGIGGSDTLVQFKPAGKPPSDTPDATQAVPIQGRILVRPSTDGLSPMILVWHNMPSINSLPQDISRFHNKGKIVALRWNGAGLEKLWETRELRGYIADYAVGELGGERAQHLVIVVVQTDKGQPRSSYVLAFPIP
ncbi:MAG: VCBS repeat-containing protein [candidate division NC10 bacterium]|nr:VCBS repeat-containing protein [candidate division NC10 bacterium]